jgi:phosphate transport system protein
MTHAEQELQKLKNDMREMMDLVQNQIRKAKDAMLNNDKELAREIIYYEKRVNAFELKIDRDCENILALLSPVAVDLRFVLANFKINTHLERIADNAEGIAKYVTELKTPFDAEAIKKMQLAEMFDTSYSMLADVIQSYDVEDSKLARRIFKKDDQLDVINMQAPANAVELIKATPDKAIDILYLLSTIRKLERDGDLIENIAEEIIFYIEAKVLKHNKKK